MLFGCLIDWIIVDSEIQTWIPDFRISPGKSYMLSTVPNLSNQGESENSDFSKSDIRLPSFRGSLNMDSESSYTCYHLSYMWRRKENKSINIST